MARRGAIVAKVTGHLLEWLLCCSFFPACYSTATQKCFLNYSNESGPTALSAAAAAGHPMYSLTLLDF